MQQAIGIRSHRPDLPTLALYRRLVDEVGKGDVRIVADELSTAPQEWPSDVRVVPITDTAMTAHGLRTDLPSVGWRCGDYAHIALREALDAERTWIVEPDVAFARISPRQFFETLEHDPADFIAHSVKPAAEEPWAWSGTLTARGFDGPEWRSFFPLTRLSNSAIDAAIRLRRATQDATTEVMHPNDEIVVATAVATEGLSWTRLEAQFPRMFRHFKYGKSRSLRRLRLFNRGPQILHPVAHPEGLPTGRAGDL